MLNISDINFIVNYICQHELVNVQQSDHLFGLDKYFYDEILS